MKHYEGEFLRDFNLSYISGMALKTENVRDQVLVEIRRLAELNGGQVPGSRTFARETEIYQMQWQGKYWARWKDAVADAGLKPNSGTEKIANDALLKMLAESVRHYARVPTSMELRMYRDIDPAFPTDRKAQRIDFLALSWCKMPVQ